MKSSTLVDLLELREPLREQLCRLFYEDVYKHEFQREELAETPEDWLPLLGGSDDRGHELLVTLAVNPEVALDDLKRGDVRGGILTEFFPTSSCGLITYVCVAPTARREGLGRRLVEHAVSLCRQRSAIHPPLILAEVEDPAKVSVDESDHRWITDRIIALDGLGFRGVPIRYIQPPLGPDKPWVDDLRLLAYSPTGGGDIPGDRLTEFLSEFAASLWAKTSGTDFDVRMRKEMVADVPKRIETVPLTRWLSAANRPSLGSADGIAVRLIVFRQPEILRPGLAETRGGGHRRHKPVSLEELQQRVTEASSESEAASILEPMQSFSWDVTVSEESGRRLPLVVPCAVGKQQEPTICVTVRLPTRIRSCWEGQDIELDLDSSDSEFSAQLVDSFAFFTTNHIAYMPSLVLPQREGDRRPSVRLLQILALLGLAGPSSVHSRSGPSLQDQMRFEVAGRRMAFEDLVTARLWALAMADAEDEKQRRVLAQEFARSDPGLSMDDVLALSPGPGGRGAFGLLISQLLADVGADADGLEVARRIAGFSRVTRGDIFGATCEIEGYDRLDDAERVITQAVHGSVGATEFTRQFAALSQGILDYENQDQSEITDSLALVMPIAGSLHLLQRRSVVRIGENSRSFARMSRTLGGCPYFLLATVSSLFNEYLIVSANREVSGLRPLTSTRRKLALDGRYSASEGDRIERRFAFYERFFAGNIPNLFRYQSERLLFDAIVEQRGIELQRQEGRQILQQIDEYWRSRNQQAQEWIESLLTTAIFGLTLWQVFGVTWEAGRSSARGNGPLSTGFRFAGSLSSILALPLLAIAIVVSVGFVIAWSRSSPVGASPRRRFSLAVAITSCILLLAVLIA